MSISSSLSLPKKRTWGNKFTLENSSQILNVENVNYTKEIGVFFDKACVGVGVKICYCKNDSIYFVYCLVVLSLQEVIKVALFVPTQMTGHNLQLWNVGMLFIFL